MKSVLWIKNLTEEDSMKSGGIKWDVVQVVRLSDIDWDVSLKNMGRLEEPLNEERVKDYATAMMNGTAFPMIVLVKMKNNKYRILSGNHRGRAALGLGEKDVAAYIVKGGSEQELDIFARSANSTNGAPPNKEEKIQQAISLVEMYGYSNKAAAQRLGLKENAVHEARRAKDCRNTLVVMGINKVEKLAQGSLLRLNQLMDLGDNVFRHAGELVTEYAVPIEEVGEMVKQVKKARTEAQRIGVVGEWEDKCRKQHVKRIAGGSIPLKTRTKFLRWLNSGANLIRNNPTRKRLQLDADELEEVRNTCVALFAKLSTILGAKK